MSILFADAINEIATDKTVRTSSLYILSKMDAACWETFQATWPTLVPQRRQEIMQNLVEISEANFEVYFIPIFKLGLNDSDAEVRAWAINGLWEETNPSMISCFVQMLETDETSLVRAAAATVLGNFIYLSEIDELDQAKVEPIKASLLKKILSLEEDIEVRRRAIESMAYLSNEDVTQIIEDAYHDESEDMQASAIFAMGRNADSRWISSVIAELDNPSSAIRFEAARACGELETSKAVNKLAELIEHDFDLEVQEMAIWALGHIGGRKAHDILEKCLDHEVEALATAAADSLDELNVYGDSFPLFDFDDSADPLEDDEF